MTLTVCAGDYFAHPGVGKRSRDIGCVGGMVKETNCDGPDLNFESVSPTGGADAIWYNDMLAVKAIMTSTRAIEVGHRG